METVTSGNGSSKTSIFDLLSTDRKREVEVEVAQSALQTFTSGSIAEFFEKAHKSPAWALIAALPVSALSNQASEPKVKATSKKTPVKKSTKISGKEIEADRVLAFVKENAGLRAQEISEKLGGDARPALDALRVEKKVRTKGKTRGTRYWLTGK